MIKRLYAISFENYQEISKREFLELKMIAPEAEFNTSFSRVSDGDFSKMPDDHLGQLYITSKDPIIVDPIFVVSLDMRVPFKVEKVIDVQMSKDVVSLYSTEPV
jgi:hypothetical protein